MSESYNRIASRIAAGGKVRTAGKIEFIRDQGPVRRDIRVDGFEWSPDSLRNLAKILWAAQRSHSYASSALRLFSRMPSSQFSPDGLLGGRGYIQSVKDLRASIANAVETLSNFTDTVYDEINAEHWSNAESAKSNQLIENAEAIKTNPDAFVEQEYRDDESDEFLTVDPSSMNPTPEDFGQVESSGSSSGGGSSAGFSQQAGDLKTDLRKIRGVSTYDGAFDSMLKSHRTRIAGGNSSLPVDTMPGPRVTHVGPGEAGEYGWFNGPDAVPSDDPSLDGFSMTDNPYTDPSNDGVTGYDHPTDGDVTFLKTAAESYSWLPGTSNDKLMPIYTPGLSDEEITAMLKSAAPENPLKPKTFGKPRTDWLWGK